MEWVNRESRMCPILQAPLFPACVAVISHLHPPAFSPGRFLGFIHTEINCMRLILLSSWSFSSFLLLGTLGAGSGATCPLWAWGAGELLRAVLQRGHGR